MLRVESILRLAIVLAVPQALLSQTITSTIRVRVVDDSGAAVTSGRVAITALGRVSPLEDGWASITEVPEGNWTITVRSLGFGPESATVHTTVPMPAETKIILHRVPLLLDPVNVVSTLSRHDSAVIRDIKGRMRVASGTVIWADHMSVRNAVLATDAIRAARGFNVKSSTWVVTRGTSGGLHGTANCESLQSAISLNRLGKKTVAVYLDGGRVPGGLDMVNKMVPVTDILAIEAYPDVISAPFLWRTNDACAVIAFWTKR
jgi:hypothetical protein